MTMIEEFKKFALRGNVVDLAVGVVIGVAFGKVVNSLVNDIIMPPIGALLGGIDFNRLAITLHPATETSEAVLIRYGSFITTGVDFLIIAFAIFMMIKIMNKILPPPTEEPKTKECPECLMSIPVKAKKCAYCQTDFH